MAVKFFLLTTILIPMQGFSQGNIEKVFSLLQWTGQAGFQFEFKGHMMYIDPYKLNKADAASLVLLTHPHQDHTSTGDLLKICNKETIIIGPSDCLPMLDKIPYARFIAMKPGEKNEVMGIHIQAVPAYNVVKNSHPAQKGWLGYVITIDGAKVYHAGDTERIPEMKNISCDIALIPLGQHYTMNSVKEAAEVAKDTKAKIVIPMHWGMYEGSRDDVAKLKELLKNIAEVRAKEMKN